MKLLVLAAVAITAVGCSSASSSGNVAYYEVAITQGGSSYQGSNCPGTDGGPDSTITTGVASKGVMAIYTEPSGQYVVEYPVGTTGVTGTQSGGTYTFNGTTVTKPVSAANVSGTTKSSLSVTLSGSSLTGTASQELICSSGNGSACAGGNPTGIGSDNGGNFDCTSTTQIIGTQLPSITPDLGPQQTFFHVAVSPFSTWSGNNCFNPPSTTTTTGYVADGVWAVYGAAGSQAFLDAPGYGPSDTTALTGSLTSSTYTFSTSTTSNTGPANDLVTSNTQTTINFPAGGGSGSITVSEKCASGNDQGCEGTGYACSAQANITVTEFNDVLPSWELATSGTGSGGSLGDPAGGTPGQAPDAFVGTWTGELTIEEQNTPTNRSDSESVVKTSGSTVEFQQFLSIPGCSMTFNVSSSTSGQFADASGSSCTDSSGNLYTFEEATATIDINTPSSLQLNVTGEQSASDGGFGGETEYTASGTLTLQ